MAIHELKEDGSALFRLQSDFLRVDVAPEVGGRIVSLVDRSSGHDFLWRNPQLRLQRLPSGSEYDPNFYGGIDELLPNDIPEAINGIDCPDHGELWTTALQARVIRRCASNNQLKQMPAASRQKLIEHQDEDETKAADFSSRSADFSPLPQGEGRDEGGLPDSDCLLLKGLLPKFGLAYEREISLAPAQPQVKLKYRLTNVSPQPRQFLWKLHAAIAIEPGDLIECPARKAQIVDPAWSRFKSLAPFDWPTIEGQLANVIPPPEGTTDFFYLYDLAHGQMAWLRPSCNLRFVYQFDTKVFPFAWLFASYGGFNGHYTSILEPCTAMPISVNEAGAKNQCSRLTPGQSLETTVTITAGRL